jgi:hypothetical protein
MRERKKLGRLLARLRLCRKLKPVVISKNLHVADISSRFLAGHMFGFYDLCSRDAN